VKRLTLILLVTLFLTACNFTSTEGEIEVNTTIGECQEEFGYINSHIIDKCGSNEDDKSYVDSRECFLYDDSYHYTGEDLDKKRECYQNINALTLTCEELKNIEDINEIEGCPTFRDKAKKSKKEVCAENYYTYCQYQFSNCGESSLETNCDNAKYTKTNSQGKDTHTDFKMDKLLETCSDKGNEDASVDELDCILNRGRIHENICSMSIDEFRSDCREID